MRRYEPVARTGATAVRRRCAACAGALRERAERLPDAGLAREDGDEDARGLGAVACAVVGPVPPAGDAAGLCAGSKKGSSIGARSAVARLAAFGAVAAGAGVVGVVAVGVPAVAARGSGAAAAGLPERPMSSGSATSATRSTTAIGHSRLATSSCRVL